VRQKIFIVYQYLIFLITIFISFFVKKDNLLLLICVKKNITENHKALFDYLSNPATKTDLKVIVLSQMILPSYYNHLTSYKTFSWRGWFLFMKTKKVLISHGKSDYRPYIRLPYQKIINMWHGIPLKKIGYNRNELKAPWDFHIVSSIFEKEIIMSSFSLEESQIKILGVPKNDILFSSKSPEIKNQILYLNTYRKSVSSKFFSFENRNLNQIDKLLKKHDTYMVFKLHPNEMNNLNMKELLNFSQFKIADQSFNIQKELKQSLGLITDYSGAVFDALGIDIPVILLPYDLQEYNQITGFNRKYEKFLPNSQAIDQIRFIELLKNIIHEREITEQESEKYRYYEYLDQKSSLRLLRFIESIK
jgi:CDP-glycerol glycerophosphotransferase